MLFLSLPLDPILLFISELLPKVEELQTNGRNSQGPNKAVIALLRNATLGDVLPPAPSIVARKFLVRFSVPPLRSLV